MFQLILPFSPQKQTIPYNQAMEGVWKVKYPVFFMCKAFWIENL